MAFVHGKSTRIMVDGYDVSSFTSAESVDAQIQAADVTCHTDASRAFIVGLDSGSATISGFFSYDRTTAADDIDNILQTAYGAAAGQVVTVAWVGLATGRRCSLLASDQTSLQRSSPVSDPVTFSAALQADGGVAHGVALRALAAATTTGVSGQVTTTGQGPAVNGGAVGHIHITAHAGTTPSMTCKIQHRQTTSGTGSTWADLITFAAKTSTSAHYERKTCTGTVYPYLREIRSAVTGVNPSFTYTVAVARKPRV